MSLTAALPHRAGYLVEKSLAAGGKNDPRALTRQQQGGRTADAT